MSIYLKKQQLLHVASLLLRASEAVHLLRDNHFLHRTLGNCNQVKQQENHDTAALNSPRVK